MKIAHTGRSHESPTSDRGHIVRGLRHSEWSLATRVPLGFDRLVARDWGLEILDEYGAAGLGGGPLPATLVPKNGRVATFDRCLRSWSTPITAACRRLRRGDGSAGSRVL